LENGWELKTEWVTTVESKAFIEADNPWVAHLDLADSEGLVVRPRVAGEWFLPLGMAGHSKRVKEVMIDRKIPAELRSRWPIVAGSHLLWITGHLIDERVRVREDSQRILKLSLRKRDQEK
jgi:tRNA(Ile)-lysidine synthetase-like protein